MFGEFFGRFCQIMEWKSLNHFYFTFFAIPLQFLFFYWLYFANSNSTRLRNIVMGSSTLYLISLFIETVLHSYFKFYSLSYALGVLLLLIIVIMFLLELIKNQSLQNFTQHKMFYITIGILLFYLGSLPFYAFKDYFWEQYKSIGKVYWHVATFLNCVMYCMFTASFIWGKSKSISQ